MNRQNHLYAVLNATPVNKQAAFVVLQSGCEDERGYLTKKELVWLVTRLQRKHRLLKRVLGIKTKAQHTNVMYAFNKRRSQYRMERDPRSFAEYVRCGHEIKRLHDELAVDRKCRQLAAQAEVTHDKDN